MFFFKPHNSCVELQYYQILEQAMFADPLGAGV